MSPKNNSLRRDDVAIITVSYNSSSQIDQFLSHAVDSVTSSKHIFVVDNNSADAAITQKLCKQYKANFIPLHSNLGYGGAINASLEHLPAKLTTLVISNPDTYLNSQTITVLSERVANKKIGAAGPKILNEDGTVYPSAREIPSLRNGIGHGLFANIWPSNPWTKKYLSDTTNHHTRESGWVSGACFAIRRELFEKMNGFDSHYFMYFEDVDLGYRLNKAGFTNLYVPEASVQHIGGESTKMTKKAMLKYHHESASRFIGVKYSGLLWAPMRWIVRVGLAIRFRFQARKATT